MSGKDGFVSVSCSGAGNISTGLCLSAPGFLPEADCQKIGVECSSSAQGVCVTVRSGKSLWSFVPGCGEKLYRLSLHITAGVVRVCRESFRKVRSCYNKVKAAMRPMVPQRLRL